MKPKLQTGDIFQMGRIKCTVVTVDKFGPTPHYGFFWQTDAGESQKGFMPCLFVESFTGFIGNAFDGIKSNQL